MFPVYSLPLFFKPDPAEKFVRMLGCLPFLPVSSFRLSKGNCTILPSVTLLNRPSAPTLPYFFFSSPRTDFTSSILVKIKD